MARGSPQQIALLLRRQAHAFERAIREAEAQAAAAALAEAQKLSSAPYSTAELRRMGHPYATRAPRPPGDAAQINVQTGRFRAAWRIVGPRKTKSGLSTRLVNDSPEAKLLLSGTRYMIARPILTRVRQRIAALRARLHRQAVKQVFRG